MNVIFELNSFFGFYNNRLFFFGKTITLYDVSVTLTMVGMGVIVGCLWIDIAQIKSHFGKKIAPKLQALIRYNEDLNSLLHYNTFQFHCLVRRNNCVTVYMALAFTARTEFINTSVIWHRLNLTVNTCF